MQHELLEGAGNNGAEPGAAYQFVPRSPAFLAYGELVRESILGTVRVAAIESANTPPEDTVQITWSDDDGPCRPTARYPGDHLLAVRTPTRADYLRI